MRRSRTWIVTAVTTVTVALVITGGTGGCASEGGGPNEMGKGQTSSTLRQLQLGREVYATYCVGCHGDKGDGAGPAARFLDPKPRDFRVGRIKFKNVSSGEAPNDQDYMRVIAHGLSGTAMPSFALLSEQERGAVVSYVKAFAIKKQLPGGSLAIGQDPWTKDPAKGIAEGDKVYHAVGQCWSCHSAYEPWPEIARMRVETGLEAGEMPTDIYESKVKESEWGASIRPPDFLVDRVKTGVELESLARVIGAGVGGTAMPTWAGVLTPKQIWGLAYYVRSIALLRGRDRAIELQRRLVGNPTAAPPSATAPSPAQEPPK